MGSGDDELELGGEFTYVQELGRLGELLGTVSSGASGFMRQDMHGAARVAEAVGGEVVEPVEQDAIEAACIEISEIFERYQLQPALLDPHLEGWLAQLFVPIKADDKVRLHHVCRAVYVLAKVRGYKTVVKFFPHEVRDLEPALELLLAQGEPADTTHWETKYVVLLWLSIIVRVPFNLASIDTSQGAGDGGSLLDRIMSVAQSYLPQPAKTRDGAAVLISQLLTRPDVEPQLVRFTTWANEQLERTAADADDGGNVYMVCGVFGALAGLFKSGERDRLRTQVVPRVFESVLATVDGATSTTQRKLAVKLIQRMGLTFMEPRNQQWRYTKSLTSLEKNLKGSTPDALTDAPAVVAGVGGLGGDEEDDDDFDVDEEVEQVIDVLLTHLKDTDTVVRWSAAKGVGRLTGRLPLAFADEVLEALLELLSPAERDTAWHGACLALAELCRRGLLLPDRLPSVLPLVFKALVYEVPRSNASIGDHVRDAACYVSWAFARAFHPSVVAPHMGELSTWLLIASTTDREVHCRRAASAALQEAAGRQGTEAFPMGIDIVTAADYFTLGQRSNAFLEVLPQCAAMADYGPPLVHHLATNKLQHWEPALRQLAAETLGRLAAVSKLQTVLIGEVLPALLPRCTHRLVPVRHGAIWGVAELVLGLSRNGALDQIEQALQDDIAQVVARVEEKQQYRGKGGEMLRGATCRLIECIADAGLHLDAATTAQLQTSLDDQLRHPTLEIVQGAVAALRKFAPVCHLGQSKGATPSGAQNESEDARLVRLQKIAGKDVSDALVERLPLMYAQVVEDGCVSNDVQVSSERAEAARGYCLGLGALPGALLAPASDRVIDVLIAATCRKLAESGSEAAGQDAELRRNAVDGLGNVCTSLHAVGALQPVQMDRAFAAVMTAFSDYAMDNRGDVGSWVREAAMAVGASMVRLQLVETAAQDDDLIAKMCQQIFPVLVKQAVEKIDRLRGHAGTTLQGLLHNEPSLAEWIPNAEEILAAVPSDAKINWQSSKDSFPALVGLLNTDAYHYPVLSGLVVSVGGLTESLLKHGRDELLTQLEEAEDPEELVLRVADSLLRLLREANNETRVVIPTLKTIEFLLESMVGLEELQPPEHAFSTDLVKLIRAEIRAAPKDIHLVLATCNTLSASVLFEEPTRTDALSAMLMLLCHRYPKVRLVVAETLHNQLVASGDELGLDEDAVGQISTIIEETHWDKPTKEVRPLRNKIVELLGLPPLPTAPAGASKPVGVAPPKVASGGVAPAPLTPRN